MKNKSGFIATSLIYTFFLAFIAILTALLSNYLANKTILDRYNGDIQNKLNNGNGSVSLYVSYASIDDGKTITNLVRNGNFSDGLNEWNIQGGGNFLAVNFIKPCIIKNGYSGYLSQPINVVPDHKYYLRMEYHQVGNYNGDVFVSSAVDNSDVGINKVISSSISGDGWKSISEIVELTGSELLRSMIVGKQSYGSSSTYYTNLLLMDITYAFNDSVSKDWLDNNIDYFDGTVSFLKKDFADDDEITFTLVPYSGYKINTINCDYDNYERTPTTDEVDTKYLFKFKNNSHDNRCNITFKHE